MKQPQKNQDELYNYDDACLTSLPLPSMGVKIRENGSREATPGIPRPGPWDQTQMFAGAKQGSIEVLLKNAMQLLLTF